MTITPQEYEREQYDKPKAGWTLTVTAEGIQLKPPEEGDFPHSFPEHWTREYLLELYNKVKERSDETN